MKKKVDQEAEDLMMLVKFMKDLQDDKVMEKQKQLEFLLIKMMRDKLIKLLKKTTKKDNWKFQDQIQILLFNNQLLMQKCLL